MYSREEIRRRKAAAKKAEKKKPAKRRTRTKAIPIPRQPEVVEEEDAA
jgi:hypothetical protein